MMVRGVSASPRTARELMFMTCRLLPADTAPPLEQGRCRRREPGMKTTELAVWTGHGAPGICTLCVSSTRDLWLAATGRVRTVEDGSLGDIGLAASCYAGGWRAAPPVTTRSVADVS